MTLRPLFLLSTLLACAPMACDTAPEDTTSEDAAVDSDTAQDTSAEDVTTSAPDASTSDAVADADAVEDATEDEDTAAPAGTLINPDASAEALALMERLQSTWGTSMLSGQTIQHHDEVVAIVGASPVVVAWDVAPYTEGYAWKWDSSIGGHSFGAVDDGTIDDVIAHVKASGGCLVPTLQWHWHAPADGTAGSNAFYTSNTTFDVTQAVIPGTTEHTLVLRDIDAIAAQLGRLQSEGIAVLWRPLHEAGGSWFWWGAAGPEPVLALWDIVYDRMTRHHGLDNLIWVWSTPEAEYYPGNDRVDILGLDSYPGHFDYTCRADVYASLSTLTAGQKLLAMTENGPVPDIDACFAEGATWAYFMTWAELSEESNTHEHLQATYAHDKVVVLGDCVEP